MSTGLRWLGFVVGGVMLSAGVHAAEPAWTPNDWTKEETVKLCTNVPGEGEYCFPVWLVVINGDVYVRLGSKATERMRKNTGGFVLPIELAGHRFEHVRATETPDYVDRVNQAMADKYTGDIIIHHFSHPLTMRLRPESAAP
ncbi:MAG TPA: hypothetical protein VL403_06700 [Candidatus Kryptonia bacterium]|nr:hypothetical protein [Candidatus Kryptonia bacterium]